MTAFLATAHPNLEVKHYRPAMDRMRAAAGVNRVSFPGRPGESVCAARPYS